MRKNIAQFTSLTPQDWQYPAFVAVHDHGDHVCVTVRGKRTRDDAKGRDLPGPIAEITMSHDEWVKMLADAVAYKRGD